MPRHRPGIPTNREILRHPETTVPEILAARLRDLSDAELQLIGRTGPAFTDTFDNGFDNGFDNAFDNS